MKEILNEKSMDFYTKITMLIPTRDRPLYLLRVLKYYSFFDFPFKIFVLDSSTSEYKNNELNQILNNNQIKIFKFDKNINLFRKCVQGLDNVTTPYSVFCADDDFIVPRAIGQCISFLDDNLDYVSTHGRYIGFNLKRNQMQNLRNEFNWRPRYLADESATINDPLERVKHYLSHYYGPVFYSIHRTNIHKLSMDVFRNKEKSDLLDGELSEILQSAISHLYGKKKVLDVFYSSRELGSIWFDDEGFQKHMFSLKKRNIVASLLSKHIQKIVNNLNDDVFVISKDLIDSYSYKIEKIANKNEREMYLNIVEKRRSLFQQIAKGIGAYLPVIKDLVLKSGLVPIPIIDRYYEFLIPGRSKLSKKSLIIVFIEKKSDFFFFQNIVLDLYRTLGIDCFLLVKDEKLGKEVRMNLSFGHCYWGFKREMIDILQPDVVMCLNTKNDSLVNLMKRARNFNIPVILFNIKRSYLRNQYDCNVKYIKSVINVFSLCSHLVIDSIKNVTLWGDYGVLSEKIYFFGEDEKYQFVFLIKRVLSEKANGEKFYQLTREAELLKLMKRFPNSSYSYINLIEHYIDADNKKKI